MTGSDAQAPGPPPRSRKLAGALATRAVNRLENRQA